MTSARRLALQYLTRKFAGEVLESGEYDRMVEDEIKRWHAVLDPLLKPYEKSIRRVQVNSGEKSWIHTYIDMG